MRRHILLVIAGIAAAWALIVQAFGPLAVTIAGVRVSSSDVRRPALVGLAAAVIYVGLAGLSQVRRDLADLGRLLNAARAAALLSVVVLAIGVANNSWTAGGPDSYAYVTQADLLLQGRLTVPVALATRAPWPQALMTFTPLGYRALPDEAAIAPATGPGLPLLMAAFKIVFGHPAAFLVVPLTGALLVWATFLIGTRLHSSTLGLAAAWLVATSPTFLMMFKSQMSDVPSAAAWAVAMHASLRRTRWNAAVAGIAASLAILIRPNLAPVAGLLFVWLTVHAYRTPRAAAVGIRRWAIPLVFIAATLPGCLVIAAINTRLWGSPLSSGYGELNQLFAIGNIPVTLGRYATWFAETQTPLAAAGFVVLLLPPRGIWPSAAARVDARFLAIIAAAVWALYGVYLPFDVWWFLRFLLPSWPALFIGTVALIMWLSARAGARSSQVHALVVIALGVYGLVVTRQQHVFTQDEGERRYATIATLVQQRTEPDAMILSAIHAGPLRYYGGRATLRFDLLNEEWLDRGTDWLTRQGRHPYVLVEDWEMPMFTSRFAGNRLADLGASPLLAYRAYNTSGTVYLFDILRREGPTLAPAPMKDPRPRCPLPAPAPNL